MVLQYTYIGLIYLVTYPAVTTLDMEVLFCEKITHCSMFNRARYYRFVTTVQGSAKT